jgi:hypothetical protein
VKQTPLELHVEDGDKLSEGSELTDVEEDPGHEVGQDAELGEPTQLLLFGNHVADGGLQWRKELTEQVWGVQDGAQLTIAVCAPGHGDLLSLILVSTGNAITYKIMPGAHFPCFVKFLSHPPCIFLVHSVQPLASTVVP